MRPLLLAALLALGCAHDPRPPPVQGWHELRSAHFRLRTDLPEASARSTLETLETLRWWLQAAWSTGGDSPGVTQAIVLDRRAELRTFTDIPGLATTTREGSLLVTAGSDVGFGDRSPGTDVLAHEIAHELIRRRMPGSPRWFHEGLAGYLQTVVSLDDHRVRFGFVRMSPTELQDEHLRSPGLLLPRELLSLDATASRNWETASEVEVTDLYLSARLWISLLRSEEPLPWRALETALAGGTPWRRAWADFRGSIDLPRLEEKMWRVLRTSWPTEVRRVPPVPPGVARPTLERLLPAWEVHLCLADLWSVASRTRGGEALAPQVRRELEKAAAGAPEQPVPLVRLADLQSDPDVRRQQAEGLVRRFPDSPEARVFLARVLRDDGGPVEGRRAAILAAVTTAPDSVDALTAHAIEEVRAGNPEGALQSVRRAEDLEPWNPGVFVARALVLGAIGRCDEAVDAVQRALDVLPDDPPPGDVRTLVQERERIGEACRRRAGP